MRPNSADIYETDEEGGYVAVNARIHEGWVLWADLTHGRAFQIVEIVKDTPKELVFTDPQGRQHFLRVIDQAAYNRLHRTLCVTDPKVKDPGSLKLLIRRSLR